MGSTNSHMGCQPSKSFSPIPDGFVNLGQVQSAIREAGLESSNLILAVDFTKSNQWTGRETFGGHSLHDTQHGQNPYQHVIEIMGRTLEEFDDDNLIPCFGFGDVSTGDQACFSFNPDGSDCLGFEHVLRRYQEVASSVRMAGPTCFAPAIRKAIEICAAE